MKLFRREKNNCFFILFCGQDIQLGDWGRKARMSVCGVQKGLGRWRYWAEYVTSSHCLHGHLLSTTLSPNISATSLEVTF